MNDLDSVPSFNRLIEYCLHTLNTVADKFSDNVGNGLVWLQSNTGAEYHQALDALRFWIDAGKESLVDKSLVDSSSDKLTRFTNLHRPEVVDAIITEEKHTDRVWYIAFSPDETRFASCSSDHTVRIWDANTGRCIIILKGHTDEVNRVAFSPDGRQLMSGADDKTVRLWDISTDEGKCLATFEGHTALVWALAFSPDGRRMASSSNDKTVRVWDIETNQCVATFKYPGARARSVVFSPDGQHVAEAFFSDSKLLVWDINTESAATLEGHTEDIKSVVFSPDGERIASGSDDQTIRLWEARTGTCLAVLGGEVGFVISLTFSPDGGQIMAHVKSGTHIWSTETHQSITCENFEDLRSASSAFYPALSLNENETWLLTSQLPAIDSFWHAIYHIPSSEGKPGTDVAARRFKAVYGTMTGSIIILDCGRLFGEPATVSLPALTAPDPPE
jgi:WD40 repeat protein